jgi:hypothetical protein
MKLYLHYWIGLYMTYLLHLAYLKTPAVFIFPCLCIGYC